MISRIEIEFCVSAPEKSIIKSNTTRETIGEILRECLNPNIQQIESKNITENGFYEISITFNVMDDELTLESTTGSKDFTCEIIKNILDNLNELSIQSI